jgi:hypothetical protein
MISFAVLGEPSTRRSPGRPKHQTGRVCDLSEHGVQLHAELAVPKGNDWLRTGVYDQESRRVGIVEIALSSVVPLQVSTK